jgi:hypothetical protein
MRTENPFVEGSILSLVSPSLRLVGPNNASNKHSHSWDARSCESVPRVKTSAAG